MPYVELHARSAFSFLRGASSPEQLAETAAALELPAVALCDRNGVYGAPRFHAAAREQGIRPIVGSDVVMEDGSVLPLLVATRGGYQNLCRMLTRAHLRAPKGEGRVRWAELREFAGGLAALTGDGEGPLCPFFPDVGRGLERLRRLRDVFGPGRLFVELQRHRVRGEDRRVAWLTQLARRLELPVLATNGVFYAKPENREVFDVFTCIREHAHLDAAGRRLSPNSERCLKHSVSMHQLFADLPDAVENTVALADQLEFTLENLGYEFPVYPVPAGETADGFLRRRTLEGAKRRYGDGLNAAVLRQLDHELALIGKLGFAGYFLIVWDIVNFCRDNRIMAQGRGSAANSAVCYSLGITAVDPVGSRLLFERFLSEGRQGWPDIDIDLPSGDRRESVLQEVYRRYGAGGAAMTANVITYRGRSAAREIGKALQFPDDLLERFSNLFGRGDFPHTLELQEQVQQAGLSLEHPRAHPFIRLYQAIYGLPRHLGQHSGGMIICQHRLDSVMPLENASMPGRVVAQWDKDDCENLGIVKVDLLGLGMMAVLQDAIELTRQRGHPVDLARIPKDDPATYRMMQEADTIGVFQIESRAQMATLPRMKPRCFYDVVIEVAIIRPGPIQGGLMHPYLARRAGKEPVVYYDDRVKPVLERTLGVPLFQEQMLKIAMVMANFSGSEAEELRRALSFHRSQERMRRVETRLRDALHRNQVDPGVADQIVQAISSFALYGFPESHAISFAILAYGSAYLKTHYAPEFYVSLLNNQPMGFYSSATIIKDARRHGLRFRPVCVQTSGWDSAIEPDDSIRLGMRVVQGLREESARTTLEQRCEMPFRSLDDFKARVPMSRPERRSLAEVGAFNALTHHRRDALWKIEKPSRPGDLFTAPIPISEARRSAAETSPTGTPDDAREVLRDEPAPLAMMSEIERIEADYRCQHLTTGRHPMALLRPRLPDVWRAMDLPRARSGQRLRVAGNVICRQRPGTAKGFVFISLEDETGIANVIVTPDLFEKRRLIISQESFLLIEGPVQIADNVIHVKARLIDPLPHDILQGSVSYDFH